MAGDARSSSPRRSGNLEDITARRFAFCARSSLIAAEDTRRTAHLLARYAITTRTTSLHEHNETRKSAALHRAPEAGEHIGARCRTPERPTMSDPGAHLIRAGDRRTESGRIRSLDRRPSWPRSARSASGMAPFCSWASHRPAQRGSGRLVQACPGCPRNHRVLRGASSHPANADGSSRLAVGDCEVAVGRGVDQGARRIGQRTNL